MKQTVRRIFAAMLLASWLAGGCNEPPKPYGVEHQLFLPGNRRQVWAIAPVTNLSGQKGVDAILQADLVYQELQQVHGLTVVPVNRVVEVLAGAKMEKVETQDQAALVCDLLGCDALVLGTVTAFDPYDPPKFGGSLQVFSKPSIFTRQRNVDVRELARSAGPGDDLSLAPPEKGFVQAVGVFDAANGSIRSAVLDYARGRNDPLGPMGTKEYFVSMDRYCGFAYHSLAADLLKQLEAREPTTKPASSE